MPPWLQHINPSCLSSAAQSSTCRAPRKSKRKVRVVAQRGTFCCSSRGSGGRREKATYMAPVARLGDSPRDKRKRKDTSPCALVPHGLLQTIWTVRRTLKDECIVHRKDALMTCIACCSSTTVTDLEQQQCNPSWPGFRNDCSIQTV